MRIKLLDCDMDLPTCCFCEPDRSTHQSFTIFEAELCCIQFKQQFALGGALRGIKMYMPLPALNRVTAKSLASVSLTVNSATKITISLLSGPLQVRPHVLSQGVICPKLSALQLTCVACLTYDRRIEPLLQSPKAQPAAWSS